jgi:hypothetical protein
MNYILLAILFYLLYRFITGFVLPVAKTTSQVRKQFHNMKEQMNEAQRQHNGNNSNSASSNGVDQKPKFDIEGEYIPFEELKDK